MARLIFLFILGSLSIVHAAKLELGSPFTEHMVLQRELPVPVWGWGKPGKNVTVSVAGVKAKTTVTKDGTWKLQLAALPVGGPYKFDVSQEAEKIAFKDVLVGEVWICSGQSNMQMGRGAMIGVKPMLEAAKGRQLRSMHVTQHVSFTPSDRCEGKWTTKPSGSAVAFAFSYHLQQALNVPVGVIVTCWGSSSIEGWMPLDMTKQLPHFKTQMEGFEKNDRAKVTKLIKDQAKGKKWPLKDNIYLRTRPNILYNAMMHPVAPYAARGIVWYQGESNTKSLDSMQQYGVSLPLWCQRLRQQWGRDDFHFLAVMLPQFGRTADKKPATDPSAQSWAWFREAQIKLLKLPHTGVANTIDLGDAKNIHPKDKAPIGKRLALLAEKNVNGQKITAQGPTLAEAKINKNKIVLHFNQAEGLTTTDGKAPRSFWLAGKDGKWSAATAKIQGKTIVLTSEQVSQPQFVRYAFVGVADTNLINAAKLPAVPFRTDTFKP